MGLFAVHNLSAGGKEIACCFTVMAIPPLARANKCIVQAPLLYFLDNRPDMQMQYDPASQQTEFSGVNDLGVRVAWECAFISIFQLADVCHVRADQLHR